MEIYYINIKNLKKEKNLQHEIGRYIVCYVAQNIYNFAPEIVIENKKPKFKNSDIKFSISHSKDIVAVCFDKSEVGFDVELMQEKDFSKIAKRMKFKNTSCTKNEFYTQWCNYEAEYKLQSKAKSIYNTNLLSEYKISIASNETMEIEKYLSIHELFFRDNVD